MSTYTTAEQIDDAYSTLQRTFKSGKTKSIAWRKWQLKQMWWSVSDNEERIAKALHADLNRHDFETYFVDIGGLKQEILQTIKNLESWSSDERIDAGFLFGTLCGAHLRKEPLGVALVLGTWNFPFVVTLSPAIAAISAGCAVMVKPSEITPASQDLMAELISKYLDPDAIRVVTGGPKETTLILERRYDSIFFTGSPKIAKVVSTAAAKHLTPTTLELGGQAPCIVTPSANVDLAAKRIMLSKFLNSGQICLAANHVFVDPEVYSEFLEKAKYWANQYLAGEGKSQQTRIVNHRNYDRLVDMLNQSEGRIAFGGSQDRESKYIQPTVVEVNVKGELSVHFAIMKAQFWFAVSDSYELLRGTQCYQALEYATVPRFHGMVPKFIDMHRI